MRTQQTQPRDAGRSAWISISHGSVSRERESLQDEALRWGGRWTRRLQRMWSGGSVC